MPDELVPFVSLAGMGLYAWTCRAAYYRLVDGRWKWFRRFPEPQAVTEHRVRVCNLGSIFGGKETAWTAAPEGEDPDVQAFVDSYPDLRLLDYCPQARAPWDHDIHQRHLLIERRSTDAA